MYTCVYIFKEISCFTIATYLYSSTKLKSQIFNPYNQSRNFVDFKLTFVTKRFTNMYITLPDTCFKHAVSPTFYFTHMYASAYECHE